MIEFSHEANAALYTINENLRNLIDATVNTSAAKAALIQDPDTFLLAVSKAALSCARGVELFVAAVSESARQTGVFPTVLPCRPQPALLRRASGAGGGGDGAVVTMGSHTTGAFRPAKGAADRLRRAKSNASLGPAGAAGDAAAQLGGSQTARPSGAGGVSLLRQPSLVSVFSEVMAGGAPSQPTSPTTVVPKPTGNGGATGRPPALSFATAAGPEGGGPRRSQQQQQQQQQQAAAAAAATTTVERVVVKHGSTSDTKEGLVAAGAYLLLELLVRETMAREATWYAVADGSDEAKAIALCSPRPRAASSARLPLRTGVVGAVVRSGIAINVAPEQPTESNPLALCFPVFAATNRAQPVGAVVLLHKATGGRFTKIDEATCAHWTVLAARLVHDFGVDLTAHSFDPFRVLQPAGCSPHAKYLAMGLGAAPYANVAAHKGAAATAEGQLLADLMREAGRLLEVQADAAAQAELERRLRKKHEGAVPPSAEAEADATSGTGGLSSAPKAHLLRSQAAGIQSYADRLASSVAEFPPPFRVFYAVHHNHFSTVRGARLTGSGVTLQTQNLMDVAEYVASLEECWRRTTEDLQGIEQEHVAQLDDFRARKRKLKATQSRVTELEVERTSYQAKYHSLKAELAAIVGRPVDDDAYASNRGDDADDDMMAIADTGGRGRGTTTTAAMGGGRSTNNKAAAPTANGSRAATTFSSSLPAIAPSPRGGR